MSGNTKNISANLIYPKLYRFGSLILAVVFIFNVFGYLAAYLALDQYYYHTNLKAKKEDGDHLKKLAFAKNVYNKAPAGFQWMEKKEFRYKGKMYDVLDKEVSRDSVVFMVERDKAEERLMTAFIDYQLRNQADGPSQPSSLPDLLKLVIKIGDIVRFHDLNIYRYSLSFFTPYLTSFTNILAGIETPPPLLENNFLLVC